MDRFQDKYRIPSVRAKWWNYSAEGIYFITICTSGHDYYFGQIINKQMILSEIGIIVRMEWEKSFNLRKELFCDRFVIMPNHIHAILRIENDPVETHGRASLQTRASLSTGVSLPNDMSLPNLTPLPNGASLPNDTSLPNSTSLSNHTTLYCNASFNDSVSPQSNNTHITAQSENFTSNKNYGIAKRQPKSISSFLAGFKSVVTVNARPINSCFGWQTRFHDHIVRNDQDYQRIAYYIENNPANWQQDKFFRK